MLKGIFDTSNLEQRELKNPPKYIEDVEGFLNVFNRKKASESEISFVIEKLKDKISLYERGIEYINNLSEKIKTEKEKSRNFLIRRFNELVDLENEAFIEMEASEDFKDYDYFYTLFTDYRSQADEVEKEISNSYKKTKLPNDISKKLSIFRNRIKVIERYISKLEDQLKKGYVIKKLELCEREMKETRYDIARKIRTSGWELEFIYPVNFGEQVSDSLKGLIFDLWQKPTLKPKNGQELSMHKKQVLIKLNFLAEPKVSERTQEEKLRDENMNRMQFGRKFDRVNYKWLKKIQRMDDGPEKKLQIKKYSAKRKEYVDKILSVEKSIPKKDKNGLTYISTTRKNKFKECIQELNKVISSFKNKYILHGSLIQVVSFMLVESIVTQVKEPKIANFELEETKRNHDIDESIFYVQNKKKAKKTKKK